jgi:hypothetical protein
VSGEARDGRRIRGRIIGNRHPHLVKKKARDFIQQVGQGSMSSDLDHMSDVALQVWWVDACLVDFTFATMFNINTTISNHGPSASRVKIFLPLACCFGPSEGSEALPMLLLAQVTAAFNDCAGDARI